MPWPLSEATPALFFCSHSNLVSFPLPPLIRGCFALAVSSVFETSRLAGLSSAPRYLCAACTCGQEISIALVGEDGGSPADARLESGEFKPCGEEFECIEKRDAAPF